jgi:hypothetical protein
MVLPLAIMKPLNGNAWKLIVLEPKEDWNNINLNPKMERINILRMKKRRGFKTNTKLEDLSWNFLRKNGEIGIPFIYS